MKVLIFLCSVLEMELVGEDGVFWKLIILNFVFPMIFLLLI